MRVTIAALYMDLAPDEHDGTSIDKSGRSSGEQVEIAGIFHGSNMAVFEM